jgi:hypothetical protein
VSGPLLNATAPFSYRKGVNGSGVTLAYGYDIFPKAGIKVHGSTTTRYDFYKYEDPDKYIKTFYLDQSFFLTKSIFSKYHVGTGFTLFNIGRELQFMEGENSKVLELHFNSVDVLMGAPIWKIYLEAKVSIVQSNFPGHLKDNATILGGRLYYRFNFKKKGK